MTDSIAYALKWLQKGGYAPPAQVGAQMPGASPAMAQGGAQPLAAAFQRPMLPSPPQGLATAFAPAGYTPPVAPQRATVEQPALGIAGMYG